MSAPDLGCPVRGRDTTVGVERVSWAALMDSVLLPLRISAQLGMVQPPANSHDWRYRSFAQLLLAEGAVFGDRVAVPAGQLGEPSQCFADARAWSDAQDLEYVEGWVSTGRFPLGLEHAWCLTVDGLVVDSTWPAEQGLVYVCLGVSAAYRRSVAAPSLLPPHEDGLALLRHGLPDSVRVEAGMPVRDLPFALTDLAT
jgi:hypothetical protein